MSRHKNKFLKQNSPFKQRHKENNSELVDMAAEQIARLFWEQIKYNHRKRSK